MFLGQKLTSSSPTLGQKLMGGSSLGHKLTHGKKRYQPLQHHTVEETRTLSHDHGPNFAFQITGRDNTHSKKPLNNDLERHRREPKEKKLNHFT
jgi:hypothetical protein